jgi:hypothetical protein
MISGFDANLVRVIESHPSILVGTCNRALVPALARGFGARVIGEGAAIELLISHWPGPHTSNNIAETGRAAVTFTMPETFESYQVKGRVTQTAECSSADYELAAMFTQIIRKRLIDLGEPNELVCVAFSYRSLYRIRLEPELVFEQTPGLNAGRKL